MVGSYILKSARRNPSTSSGRAQRRTEFVFTAELIEASERAQRRKLVLSFYGRPTVANAQVGHKTSTVKIHKQKNNHLSPKILEQ